VEAGFCFFSEDTFGKPVQFASFGKMQGVSIKGKMCMKWPHCSLKIENVLIVSLLFSIVISFHLNIATIVIWQVCLVYSLTVLLT